MPEGLRVLLVDDNHDLRESTNEFLRQAGCRVVEAASAEAALELCSRSALAVDAVVTDLNLPGLDGLALIDRLRRRRPQLAALVISSRPSPRLFRRRAAGELAYCSKPYSARQLLAGLRQARRLAETPDRGTSGLRGTPRRRSAAAFPGRREAALWAAAALVVLAVGGGLAHRLMAPPPPPLPPPVHDAIKRSSRLEPVAPQGELRAAPRALHWRERDDAASYHVTVHRLDRLVWEGSVARPPANLPAGVVEALDAAVIYSWRVEALDRSGSRLAWSESVRFRIASPAE